MIQRKLAGSSGRSGQTEICQAESFGQSIDGAPKRPARKRFFAIIAADVPTQAGSTLPS